MLIREVKVSQMQKWIERLPDQIAEWMGSKEEGLNLHLVQISLLQSQQFGKSRLDPQRSCTGKDRSGGKHMCKNQSLQPTSRI